MLHTIMVRGLFLLTMNFYDDFILATPPDFGPLCKALGVQFDLCKSQDFLMFVANTDARKKEVCELIEAALLGGKLSKPETSVLQGKLGFADSFVRVRLCSLVLKKLSQHAYGRTSQLDDDLIVSLRAMMLRLQCGDPRTVSSKSLKCWHIFTDAAYEQSSQSGGLGAVLSDCQANVCSWFGIEVSQGCSLVLGAKMKESLIYELELVAAITALMLLGSDAMENLHVCYGDNDSVRFSLIRASGAGDVARSFMSREAKKNCVTWFARVPTEANIADYPSLFQKVSCTCSWVFYGDTFHHLIPPEFWLKSWTFTFAWMKFSFLGR